jgi:cytochrome P450
MPVVHSDGLLAVIAGSDTTATAITVLWYYLILDPPKSDRLRNEVDAYFPQGEEPSEFARMVNMPYLNACM